MKILLFWDLHVASFWSKCCGRVLSNSPRLCVSYLRFRAADGNLIGPEDRYVMVRGLQGFRVQGFGPQGVEEPTVPHTWFIASPDEAQNQLPGS